MSDWIQAFALGVIQAITEFLPISSSAHLILPSLLLGWKDQGMAFDVAVHFGSLLAVVSYMRAELIAMAKSCFKTSRSSAYDRRLLLCLVYATIPVLLIGFVARHQVALVARELWVIGLATFLFALPLWWADRRRGSRTLLDIRWRDALWIGMAQVLALIPGVSRSGITINAALFLGLNRIDASKFAFLLAIPVIASATTLKTWDLFVAGISVFDWYLLFVGMLSSAVISFVSIDIFMRLVRRLGMMPFVWYRLLLGGYLLYLAYYTGI